MKLPSIFIRILIVIFITGFIFLSFSKVKSAYASNSTSLHYVALGDSITAAGYDSNGGYVSRYKNFLSTDLGISVTVANLGVNSTTSSDLLSSLKNDQSFRIAVANANQVSIMIGINDFFRSGASLYLSNACGGADNQDCLRSMVATFQGNLTKIVGEIKLLNSNPSLNILLAEIYYPTIGNPTADPNFIIFNYYLAQMNSAISSISQANNLGVAGIHTAFNGASGTEDPYAKGYLVGDGLHPNSLGFDVIANEFRKLNSLILNKDTDGDGFSNKVEKRMTTDMLSSCPELGKINAWPPDVYALDNLGKVTVVDILDTVNKYMTSNPRYDFDGDGKVTIIDIVTVKSYYYKSCPK